MKTVAEVIGGSRSNLVERLQERPKKRIGRPPLPDADGSAIGSRSRTRRRRLFGGSKKKDGTNDATPVLAAMVREETDACFIVKDGNGYALTRRQPNQS
jgi:hypothetical protein